MGASLLRQMLKVYNKQKLMKLKLQLKIKNISLKNLLLLVVLFQKKLTDQLGEKIPLDTERGYHVHFENMDHLIFKTSYFSR